MNVSTESNPKNGHAYNEEGRVAKSTETTINNIIKIFATANLPFLFTNLRVFLFSENSESFAL